MSRRPILEIAVQDLAGARVARAAGAPMVELCQALGTTGGLTPSLALVEGACAVGLPGGVRVLVRPRGGGYRYDAEELAVCVRDVELALMAGAAGVVIGALTEESRVDRAATASLVAAAHRAGKHAGHHVDVTFHRALDVTPDPLSALDTLEDLGVDRVLTSGSAPRCLDGLPVLARLAERSRRLAVIAGGGVRPKDIGPLIGAGVAGVHLSARATVPADGGPGGGGRDGREVTDPATVAAAVQAWQSATES